MKRWLVFALPLLILCLAFSKGRIRKGFEALSVYNYFEAKSQFERGLKKWPSASAYGLSIIYGRNDNPFHNLDSALHYAEMARDMFPSDDLKRLEFMQLYNVTDSSIRSQILYVDSFAFARTKALHTVTAYQRFIDQHPNALQSEEAIQLRNQLAFDQVKTNHTHEGYMAFMEQYPEARQVPEARALYEETFYAYMTRDGKLGSFLAFSESYPHSPYRRTALDKVFNLSTPNKTSAELHQFVRNFPNNPNVPDAWQLIYNKEVRSLTAETLASFTLKYPDYPRMDELKEKFNLAVTRFFPVEIRGLWGFVNENGKVAVPAIYDWVEPFNEGLALVGKGGKMGFIDKSGNVVVPIRYESAELFLGGLAVVEKDDLYGAVNRQGSVVIPFKYEELGDFTDQLTYAVLEDEVGYIDKKGRTIVPFQYDFGTSFRDGFAKVGADDLYGLINIRGEEVIPVRHTYIEEFERGVTRAREDELYGLYDRKGKLFIPFEYDNIGLPYEGLIVAVRGQKLGFVNDTGAVAIDFMYQADGRNIREVGFQNGYASVLLKGKYCLIDADGKRVLPANYDAIGGWQNTRRMPVLKQRNWGYVNIDNKTVIPFRYEFAAPFKDHMAVVKFKGNYGIIDTTGAYIIEPTFRLIDVFDTLMYAAKSDDYWGLLTFSGDTLIAFEHSEYERIEDDILQLKSNGKTHYYNLSLRQWIWRKD